MEGLPVPPDFAGGDAEKAVDFSANLRESPSTTDPPPTNPNDSINIEPSTSIASTTTRKKPAPPRRKSSGFGRTTRGRNAKSVPLPQPLNVSNTDVAQPDEPELTVTQMKRKIWNQGRTINKLRLEVTNLKSTAVSLQSQLTAKNEELVAALVKAKEDRMASLNDLKAAASKAREDKKASNEVIASAMTEAQQIKQAADEKMKEAQGVRLAAERDVARVVQAERSYSSYRIESEKKKARNSMDRQVQGLQIAAKDAKLTIAKNEVLQVTAAAASEIKSLKRIHSETVVKMKTDERERKKRRGEQVHAKNMKISQMKDKHAQKVVEMQEFLDDMAADWKESKNAAIESEKRQAKATKTADDRLTKMKEVEVHLSQLKDDLDEAVRVLDLCIL
jgi:hypothetical protein